MIWSLPPASRSRTADSHLRPEVACRGLSLKAERAQKAAAGSGAAAGTQPLVAFGDHERLVLRSKRLSKGGPLRASQHVLYGVGRLAEVGAAVEDRHVVEVRRDGRVRDREAVADQPLAAAQDLVEPAHRPHLRLAHALATHAVVAWHGAEAQAVELGVGPNDPRRPSGALLRGRAHVLVGEVEEARAALEDLDTAVIGQEWGLIERVLRRPWRRHRERDAGLDGVPIDERRARLRRAVQRHSHSGSVDKKSKRHENAERRLSSGCQR
mmetsp:Transcript_32651/g.104596  ORF Transcript_32651/g.104596 Transcript_32651/m.104596 type:complete len:268 (-) Transcript_32651:1-804(-)